MDAGGFGLLFAKRAASVRAVKRLSKTILIGGGGLVVLAAGALIALNFYVKSSSVQAQIQDALGDALGLKVKLAGVSYTPFGDLKINGIQVAQPDGAPGNFIEAKSFTASC